MKTKKPRTSTHGFRAKSSLYRKQLNNGKFVSLSGWVFSFPIIFPQFIKFNFRKIYIVFSFAHLKIQAWGMLGKYSRSVYNTRLRLASLVFSQQSLRALSRQKHARLIFYFLKRNGNTNFYFLI